MYHLKSNFSLCSQALLFQTENDCLLNTKQMNLIQDVKMPDYLQNTKQEAWNYVANKELINNSIYLNISYSFDSWK